MIIGFILLFICILCLVYIDYILFKSISVLLYYSSLDFKDVEKMYKNM